MDKPERQRRWEVDQRLVFIEHRLYWDGAIRRADLQQKFGISTPQASADLTRYRESAPDNLHYDLSQKQYVASEAFAPVFYEPNPDRYLAQLRAVRNGILDSSDTFIGHVPDFDILPIPRREMSPKILRQLIRAIRTQQSIQVEYQSMNDLRPEPIWRTISPHAIGSDGMRWHVRAFCHLQEKYKDFIISRCLGTGAFGERSPNAGEDLEWRDHFDVVLKPNEAFSEAQKRTIELDYGMVDGRCVVPVRLALLYYFNKRMRLDVAERTDQPKERPIVVDNREAYDKVLARLTG